MLVIWTQQKSGFFTSAHTASKQKWQITRHPNTNSLWEHDEIYMYKETNELWILEMQMGDYAISLLLRRPIFLEFLEVSKKIHVSEFLQAV